MKNAWKMLCKILKYSINILNIIRITIANIFLLIFIIISIGIFFSIKNTKHTHIPSALILNLTGIIVDKPDSRNKWHKIGKHLLNLNQSNIQEHSLFDIIQILRYAKNDPKITGLILLLKNFSGGNQADLEYIGKALCEFKNTGKPIYAISDYYNQIQYFLASYANKIYLTPQGGVDFRGIYSSKLYFETLLKNLKINTHVFRVGSYKSAVEPFMRNNMSDQVRYEENIWINQLWNQYLKIISCNRNITKQQIFPGIDEIFKELCTMHGDTAAYALKKKWIDEIASYFVIEESMKKIFGKNQQNNSFNAINMYNYYRTIPDIKLHDNQIAIICIQGTIIDETNEIFESFQDNTTIQKIRDARLNPKIKAIVLRINSPGGGVHASELIRQEIINTRNCGKPIVVSMGNIAASGGYWISTPANFIIASNSTLTGSIGVFGVINTFERSLDTIGIHSDEVNTSPIANLSPTKPLPIEFKNMMQLYVDTSYKYFINTVAEYRAKKIKDIEQVAQGHVWLGYDAVKNGLIDKIGDFDDAINKAAEIANLTEYQLNWYDDKINWIDILIQQSNNVLYEIIFQLFNKYTLMSYLNKNHSIYYDKNKFIWNDPKNCYALCCN